MPSPVSQRLVALLASSVAAVLSWWAGGWLDGSTWAAAAVTAAAALLAWIGTGAALSRLPVTLDWNALQRAGLETHWHALRCALSSPRPAAETGAAAAEPAPDTHDRP